MKRLHPPSHKAMAGQASKSSLEFGEDVKKNLRFLSEELLRLPLCGKLQKAVKRRLTSSFAIFFAVQKCFWGIAFISFRLSRIFAKKNGGRRGIRTLGELPLGGFQDRCLKPLDHSSARLFS